MDYRSLLKDQLRSRKLGNPKFSLRSFARKIELSPSKLSEVISGKKSLSPERVQIIADRLALRGLEREIFILSAQKGIDGSDPIMTARYREVVADLQSRRSSRENAWYFGAVRELHRIGKSSREIETFLGLSTLQVDGALRYLQRMSIHFPERRRLKFNSTSVLQRIEDALLGGSADSLQVDFLFLDEEQIEKLREELSATVRKLKLRKSQKPGVGLWMSTQTLIPVTSNEIKET